MLQIPRISRIAFVGFSLTATPATAGVLDDCLQDRWSDMRLQTCSVVIDSRAFGIQDKVLAYNSRGEARMEAGALKMAIQDFTESIRLQPSNKSAFAGRGQARFASGDFAGAIADYSEAIRISPDASELYIERGHVYLTNNNFDASIRDLTEAIRLDPESASAYNNRGLAFRKKGDSRRALQDYTTAIALNPIYALAYANRGALLESQNRKPEAIADLLQAIKLDPSQAAVRVALKRLGAIDAAVKESDLRVRHGRGLAEANCSGCHSIGAKDESPNTRAPAFRDLQHRHRMQWLRKPITRGIAAPHDQMPQFVLSKDDVDMLVAYISSLAGRR